MHVYATRVMYFSDGLYALQISPQDLHDLHGQKGSV